MKATILIQIILQIVNKEGVGIIYIQLLMNSYLVPYI
jgi:hypothetical protein